MILMLDRVGPRDRHRVGGKALALARLHRHGLPVPKTVVVTADAFRSFLRHNGLEERARRGGDAGLAGDIRAGRLPSGLARELRAAAERLGPKLVVRSSAAEEDGEESSFAGQFASTLGVEPGAATEQALRECWASAFGERVRSYAVGGGRRLDPTAMGVVIQKMVRPLCAGVLFTVNPLTGSWREMTVEAAWGLGEAVVGGRVVPDFYRVRRPRRTPRPVQRVLARLRLEVIEEQIRPQELEWRGGPDDPVPVGSDRIGAAKLGRSDLLRLCRLGLRAEALLGGPQDVEWALDGRGELFVLQARPVTTTGNARRGGPVVWTRRFVGERWTEPATPLGWSLMRDLLEWFIAYPETSRRFLGGEEPTRLVRFAPYFNVTVFRHLAFKLPGAPPPRFMVELLPPDEERAWLRRRAAPADLRVVRSILAETLRERRWRRFRWNPLTNWRAWEALRAHLDRELPLLERPIGSRAEALERATALCELARSYIKVHICSLLFANIGYQITEAVLSGEGARALDVIRWPGRTATSRANRALWRLGRGEIPLDEVIAEFGHRAASSWELFSPRWAEQPERVLALARAAAAGPDPARQEAEQSARAERVLAGLQPWLRSLVRLTRRYLQLREEQRFHFDRLLWAWKRVYLWLEQDLELRVRFLDAAELDALLAGELSQAAAHELVSRRSEEYDREVARRAAGDEPPIFLVGDAAVEASTTGTRLQGLGISGGVVTGRVRVVRSLDQAERLRPGEILVTQATDPGWTPLFLTAGGLVMELGGLLSHGAVVAREYGLPAVVNVAGATVRLCDGQTVTVDGSRGVVWVR